MSQLFRKRFDEMKEGDPTSKEEPLETGSLKYSDNGHARNICFVWPDGTMEFLNYAYLVGAKYDTATSSIILRFTTDTVNIEGVNLKLLFTEIMNQLVRFIICIDLRYSSIENEGQPVVTTIEIIQNK